MKLAVVGPHEGYHLPPVIDFLNGLWLTHPDTVIVSGGATGVDSCAETTWVSLGGLVISYRPKSVGPEDYGVECWQLGGDQSRTWLMIDVPTGQTWRDAAFIRNMLIADECDRLVAFYSGRRSPGAAFTESLVRDNGKPAFAYGLKG